MYADILTMYADYTQGNSRMYVLLVHHRNVFLTLRNQAHGGRTATTLLIKSYYCWPNMDREIGQWIKFCVQTKVHKYTTLLLTPFALAELRFGHIHIDLVGPLPPSNNSKYMLICIDRFTRWP
uniref:RNA-directed DNA polymerase n=1 Tax=Sipha flava TaxID=143950 RepID=A0A2S2PXM3_9HEMI